MEEESTSFGRTRQRAFKHRSTGSQLLFNGTIQFEAEPRFQVPKSNLLQRCSLPPSSLRRAIGQAIENKLCFRHSHQTQAKNEQIAIGRLYPDPQSELAEFSQSKPISVNEHFCKTNLH
jgi:hypothetical protein